MKIFMKHETKYWHFIQLLLTSTSCIQLVTLKDEGINILILPVFNAFYLLLSQSLSALRYPAFSFPSVSQLVGHDSFADLPCEAICVWISLSICSTAMILNTGGEREREEPRNQEQLNPACYTDY